MKYKYTIQTFKSALLSKRTLGHMNVQNIQGRRSRDCMLVGFLITYAISSITTNVVSSNPAQARCTRYNIMWYSLSV